ncbi:hypothetical protein ACRRTK_014978 [Alexandromys fortis]
MKTFLVLLLALALGHALERGRDYEKDKVCKELAMLGKDDFRSLSLILYSRKFSSGTFEQISQLVKEVVALTEECCAEGADPNCYDTRTSELSTKSCESDAPFPVHPGTPECCTKEGLERKLCMAALSHQPQEFPTYVEPTNEEICEAFRKDPKGFADHHLIKLAQKVPTANLEAVLPLAEDLTQILSRCCESTSEDCMAKELPEHTLKICDNLSAKNSKFEECCQEKTPMNIFMCTYFMPAAEPVQSPAIKLPTKTDLCGQRATQVMDKLAERLRTKTPNASAGELEDMVDKRSDFASKCCSTNSPPLYCSSQIDAEMKDILQS